MACILVSRIYLVKKSEEEIRMVVNSVVIVMLSLDPDQIFVEVDIMMNRLFNGLHIAMNLIEQKSLSG